MAVGKAVGRMKIVGGERRKWRRQLRVDLMHENAYRCATSNVSVQFVRKGKKTMQSEVGIGNRVEVRDRSEVGAARQMQIEETSVCRFCSMVAMNDVIMQMH